MKKNNNKGFTLAELLIVVAIIAVLVAIAIPVFIAQLQKSQQATDVANVRAAYAEAVTKAMSEGGSASKETVPMVHSGGWSKVDAETVGTWPISQLPDVSKGDTLTVKVDKDGGVTIE